MRGAGGVGVTRTGAGAALRSVAGVCFVAVSRTAGVDSFASGFFSKKRVTDDERPAADFAGADGCTGDAGTKAITLGGFRALPVRHTDSGGGIYGTSAMAAGQSGHLIYR